MIQEILTYTIILIAIGITLFKFLQSVGIFGRKKAMSSSCSTCSSGACGSCSLNTSLNNKPKFPLKVIHEEVKIK